MDAERAAGRADELFNGDWNCAESVYRAIHEQVGEGEPPVHLLTPLGGGLASGVTCGALTGAAVALGLTYGRGTADKPLDPAYEASERLCDGFRHEMNATDCAEVTCWDCDDAIRHRTCVEAVRTAATLACRVMDQELRNDSPKNDRETGE